MISISYHHKITACTKYSNNSEKNNTLKLNTTEETSVQYKNTVTKM